MKQVWSLSLPGAVLSLSLFTSPAAGQESVFTFDFAGPTSFSGSPGATNTATYDCRLSQVSTPGDTAGAQGWSMGVTADNATILSITYAGTVSANKVDGGKEDAGFADFQPTQPPAGTVTCPGGAPGVVSAVVLSFRKPITLAPDETHVVAKIDVMTTIPAGGGTATLRYLSGCEGAGEPVELAVTQTGQTKDPVVIPLVITLSEFMECCTAPFNVGFSAAPLNEPTPYTGFVETPTVPPTCAGAGGTIAVDVAPGATGETKVYAGISSNNAVAGKGAQGWSMSIKEEGDVHITFATAAGTVGGPKSEGGLQDAGFEQTELALPDNPGNAGMSGVVTAVVLSFRKPITLPAAGTASVLCMTVQAAGPQGDADQVGTLRFLGGLEGSGEPVDNVITVEGGSATPCNAKPDEETAAVNVLFRAVSQQPFIRGNANNDLKVNIADPIWIINEIFNAGPVTGCQDAADANGDNIGPDLSDATYLISYQFSGGPAPPAPFPACGLDPEGDDDGITCEEGQLACQ